MTWKRAYGKKDKNHDEICNVFKSHGYSVASTHGQGKFVDAVAAKEITLILEIKVKGKCISIEQLEFLSSWRGAAAIVVDVDSAKDLAVDPHGKCLSLRQKSLLTQFCLKERFAGANDDKEYSVNKILKMIQ